MNSLQKFQSYETNSSKKDSNKKVNGGQWLNRQQTNIPTHGKLKLES